MSDVVVLPADSLGRLFDALVGRGYACVGPTLGDGAIVHGPLDDPSDLPRGWTDRQAPGEYRLERRDDGAYFGHGLGPHSWKQHLFPPEQVLWRLRRRPDGFERVDLPERPARRAFVGVRACELAALGIQDRVFGAGPHPDDAYARARAAAFVVAVACTRSGATCFCASTGTGPAIEGDCDLALTELVDEEHVFLAQAHGPEGRAVLAELALAPASPEQRERARAAVARAAEQTRTLATEGLPALLRERLESPHWEQVAERCLACGNCTSVCPTCFCSDVEDVSDLTGEVAERRRRWDSCFAEGFSRLHGGEVRAGTAARYRQWLTHKLGTWVEQFGVSGCVGCGRCITWCPPGIDLTEELARLREEEP